MVYTLSNHIQSYLMTKSMMVLEDTLKDLSLMNISLCHMNIHHLGLVRDATSQVYWRIVRTTDDIIRVEASVTVKRRISIRHRSQQYDISLQEILVRHFHLLLNNIQLRQR